MTFEQTVNITCDVRQLDMHIAALISYQKRQERNLITDAKRIAGHQRKGETAIALKMIESTKERKEWIAEIGKEIERMREIEKQFDGE